MSQNIDFDPAIHDKRRDDDQDTVKPAGRDDSDTDTVKPAGRLDRPPRERQTDGTDDTDDTDDTAETRRS